MRIVSWNVNGIRAVMKKNFEGALETLQTDVLCLQETRAQEDQVAEALATVDGFHIYSNSALKKGYAGTAVLTKTPPLNVFQDMGVAVHDQEGRVIALEFERFMLVTVYTPNSGSELKRLEYRRQWDADFLIYLKELARKKPLVACGDFNVAHRPIDLARPEPNYNKTAGYTQAEIDGMDNIAAAGFIDTFRMLHPDEVKYSWWSFRGGARRKNVGWRIDYFLISPEIRNQVKRADILTDVMGSDHCPVLLDLTLKKK
ncbi:MAG: exodeoxyribonuclease III [Deltaproteobacteria bacterium]